MSGLHAQVPLALCRADLTPAAKAVCLAYWSHADFTDRTCYPSNATIMAEAGVKVDGFRRARQELEKAGWIVRLPSSGSSSLTFVCVEPGEQPPWLNTGPPRENRPTPLGKTDGVPPRENRPLTTPNELDPSNYERATERLGVRGGRVWSEPDADGYVTRLEATS